MTEAKIAIPEDQVHSGGTVDPISRHDIPLDDQVVPWHQGRLAEWAQDDYTEYAHIGESWSRVARGAHRIRIDLATTFTNRRSYHDWKGYDDIEPVAHTRVSFNDIPVGSVTGHGDDMLRHLLAVERYCQKLRSLPFGWWTRDDIQKAWGRQVKYREHVGVIEDSWHVLDHGCIMVNFPDWPKDDPYWSDGIVKLSLTSNDITWHVT